LSVTGPDVWVRVRFAVGEGKRWSAPRSIFQFLWCGFVFGLGLGGFRVWGLGFRLKDSGFRVWGLGFRFRVRSIGFKVWGVEFRV